MNSLVRYICNITQWFSALISALYIKIIKLQVFPCVICEFITTLPQFTYITNHNIFITMLKSKNKNNSIKSYCCNIWYYLLFNLECFILIYIWVPISLCACLRYNVSKWLISFDDTHHCLTSMWITQLQKNCLCSCFSLGHANTISGVLVSIV